MRTWLINLWDSFRAGFWFIPTLLIIAAVLLAIVVPAIDDALSELTPDWLRTKGDTARSTLTTLASAMFTVAGVVFSVTVVTLSITSSQLGPRLLRTFLEESITQFAMGSCIACSIYCLILLWRIDDAGGTWFVPHIAVALATVMTLLALCVVVYFIHRVAHAVQSMHVVADVAADLDRAIERLFPDRIGDRPGEDSDFAELYGRFQSEEPGLLKAPRDGYLQAIDGETLLGLASKHDLIVCLECSPGDFLVKDRVFARCLPAGHCDEQVARSMGGVLLLGNRRTPRQDVECAIDELVEIALRALSPGINDPYTAVASIDRLAATFCRLAGREPAASIRVDSEGAARVIAQPREFPDLLKTGFDQLRRHGAANLTVSLRLLRALELIATCVTRSKDHQAILKQARLVVEGVKANQYCAGDLEEIDEQFQRVGLACRRQNEAIDPLHGIKN